MLNLKRTKLGIKVRLVINHAKRVWNLTEEVDALDDKLRESEQDLQDDIDKCVKEDDLDTAIEASLEDTLPFRRLDDRVDDLEDEITKLKRAVFGNRRQVGA